MGPAERSAKRGIFALKGYVYPGVRKRAERLMFVIVVVSTRRTTRHIVVDAARLV